MAFKSDKQRKAVMAILKKQFGGKVPKGHIVLFHVSPKTRAKRILKEGLVPRTHSTRTDLRRKFTFLTPEPYKIIEEKKRFFPSGTKPKTLAVAVRMKQLASPTRKHLKRLYALEGDLPPNTDFKFKDPGGFSKLIKTRPYREFVLQENIPPGLIREAKLSKRDFQVLKERSKRNIKRLRVIPRVKVVDK